MLGHTRYCIRQTGGFRLVHRKLKMGVGTKKLNMQQDEF
jgi:hypothetical protein